MARPKSTTIQPKTNQIQQKNNVELQPENANVSISLQSYIGSEKANTLTAQLDEKQQKFAEIMATGNMTPDNAVIEAGYVGKSLNYGRTLLNKKPIQNYIHYLKERRFAASGIDDYWVIDRLVETTNRALAEGKYTAAVRAIELVGKHRGMFGRDANAIGSSAGVTKDDLVNAIITMANQAQNSVINTTYVEEPRDITIASEHSEISENGIKK